jgi:polyisoprenoid-binding protein YceI
MIKRVVLIGGLVVIALAVWAGYAVLRTPDAPSSEIEAIPVVIEEDPAEEPVEVTSAPEEPTQVVESEEAEVISETAGDLSGTVVFTIVPSASEARFSIDEVLNGADKTVIGATDQVGAEIAVNFDDPTGTQVGTIQVNARALLTDNEFRNRAIKNQILRTDEFEFVVFTPTDISGMPAEIALGDSYTFQINGDLTVRDVTQPVTFDVQAILSSPTTLEGTASTIILYADFGIVIPQARSVSSVEDEVILEIDFVAEAG